jgi:hypothetical protein
VGDNDQTKSTQNLVGGGVKTAEMPSIQTCSWSVGMACLPWSVKVVVQTHMHLFIYAAAFMQCKCFLCALWVLCSPYRDCLKNCAPGLSPWVQATLAQSGVLHLLQLTVILTCISSHSAK